MGLKTLTVPTNELITHRLLQLVSTTKGGKGVVVWICSYVSFTGDSYGHWYCQSSGTRDELKGTWRSGQGRQEGTSFHLCSSEFMILGAFLTLQKRPN